MPFRVIIKKKAEKSLDDLPEKVQSKFWVLVRELRLVGPIRGNWPNFSKLGSGEYHCISILPGSPAGAGKSQR
jgi:mRNA-degrading endonuclease RelE of RelBE toxin-antitoxin system